MLLYEVDRRIADLIDPETGELTDPKALEALLADRDKAIEGILLTYKNLSAEAAAIKNEINALKERLSAVTRRADRYKELGTQALAGEPFRTGRVTVSYRTTSSVSVNDREEFLGWAKDGRAYLLRYSDPEPDKTAIAALLKAGESVPGCALVRSTSMSVK